MNKVFFKFFIILVFSLSGFAYGFFSYHFKFFPYNEIKNLYKISTFTEVKNINPDQNRIWAKKIVEGGYILHVRHAMREKWADVTGFDAIELLDNLDARKSSYYRAVCLTEKGIEDAKLINRAFELSGLEISYVLSSPVVDQEKQQYLDLKELIKLNLQYYIEQHRKNHNTF